MNLGCICLSASVKRQRKCTVLGTSSTKQTFVYCIVNVDGCAVKKIILVIDNYVRNMGENQHIFTHPIKTLASII
jgi:hypothetical protein